jgi:glycosyltransferase involved in cell wall biosynthesis
MKISLITATFNSAGTVLDALESVARQKTACEIDHIIVDGASTDGTVEEVVKLLNDGCWEDVSQRSEIGGQRSENLKTYQLNNRTTVILSEKDNGIYDAMNKGIRMVAGDVIGLLNSDDMLAAPDVFEKISQAFIDPSVEVVYGDLVYVDKAEISKVRRVWHSGRFSPRKLSLGWHPAHPTLYLRRSVYEKYGLFDLNYLLSADVEFMMRIFSKGIKAKYIPEVLVHMRTGGATGRVSNLWKQNWEVMMGMRKNNVLVSHLFWPAKLFNRAMQFVRGAFIR